MHSSWWLADFGIGILIAVATAAERGAWPVETRSVATRFAVGHIRIDCSMLDRENAVRIYRTSAVEFLLGNHKEGEFVMNRGEVVGQLKSQSTWRLFFLSIITLGIYTAHYIKRQTTIINQHLDRDQISEGFVNFLLIFAYVTVILIVPYVLVEEGHPVERISDSLDSLWGILVLLWAFMARNRMNMPACRNQRSAKLVPRPMDFSIHGFLLQFQG